MKKIISLLLTLVMLVSCFSCVAFAEDEIKVLINGTALTMDQPPVIVNDRTLVPVRAIFEGLGATVEWDDATKCATGNKDGKEIKITIDNATAYVDGKAVTLDVPAQIISSRTMVPVRFISENLGEKVDWDAATRTVIITSEAKNAVFELTFDLVNTLELNKDFITGASYDASGFSVTDELDHTTGNGKSAKMDGRKSPDHRVKFLNAFAKAEIGKTYVVSAYVLTKEDAKNVSLGVFGDVGTANAYTPAKSESVDVKANEWTKIEFEYKHTDSIISQIGVDQRPAKESPSVETIYIDDVKIVEKSGENAKKQTLVPVTLRESKRPTPSANGLGKTYDDLIFYERTFEEKADDKKDSELMFNALPKNPKVMADNSDLMASRLTGGEYATVEKIEVENMPFTDALRANVTKLSPNVYDTQLVLESLGDDTFEEGDNMLIVFYLRTLEADNEFSTGHVQLIVEQEVAPNDKALQENVKTIMGSGWKKVYLPFTAKKGFTRLCIRLGYYIQTVEFGGYQILNYGKDVKFEDLPTDTVMEDYDGRELFEKDVDWRKEAWDRIEQVRRGDIKVIVKDAAGNVIPDADVKIDMYDHEFKWGTAVNTRIIEESETGENYREAVSTFFNTGVGESSFKPAEYMKNPDVAKAKFDKAKELGLKYFRGHTFVWDRGLVKTYDEEKDEWIENTTTSEELVRLTLANDEAGIDAYIENTIKTMAEAYEGKLCDWDVVNEILNNNEIKTRFGSGVIKKWFDWAQKYDTTAKMYINETSISGRPENGKARQFKMVLDDMVSQGVDFDGIGIQGHISIISPKAFYDEVMEFVPYGKEMKITEFDTGLIEDKELDASFIRDVMILMFSIEQMDGFIMWGFWDGQQWRDNGPLFDRQWNLKLSGEQYIDLVYNKWWTQENGKTAQDGTYSTKGYYGDYLITATKDGKTSTADVKCYKGNDNTIEIVLK